MEIHADILDENLILFKDSQVKKFLSLVWHKYNLFFFRRADGLIFNNPLLEKYFKHNYLSKTMKTISVHNGCDPEFFYPIEKQQARKKLNLSAEVTYLLFIGSLSRWHGVEHLIKTYGYIRNNCAVDNIKLLVVGGYIKDYLNELKENSANSDIVFRGEVAKEEALYYINAADICLLPVSKIRISPGSPLKLFDYAACGKPIIAQKNTVGYSDLVEEFDLGISCDFTDNAGAAKIIIDYINNYNEDYYRQHNREIAENYFSWEKVLLKWLDFCVAIKLELDSRRN